MKTISFKQLTDEKIKTLISREDFKDVYSKRNSEQVFEFKNVASKTDNELVDLEVAFRRCKRAGFFRQPA